MPVEFIGKEIEVKLSDGPVRQPTAFKLGAKEHALKEVLASWQDQAYGGLPARGQRWQDRPQRQFYRVRTAEGEVYEIYVETAAGRRSRPGKARWYAQRRIAEVTPSEGAVEEAPAVEAPPARKPRPKRKAAAPNPSATPARRPRGG